MLCICVKVVISTRIFNRCVPAISLFCGEINSCLRCDRVKNVFHFIVSKPTSNEVYCYTKCQKIQIDAKKTIYYKFVNVDKIKHHKMKYRKQNTPVHTHEHISIAYFYCTPISHRRNLDSFFQIIFRYHTNWKETPIVWAIQISLTTVLDSPFPWWATIHRRVNARTVSPRLLTIHIFVVKHNQG